MITSFYCKFVASQCLFCRSMGGAFLSCGSRAVRIQESHSRAFGLFINHYFLRERQLVQCILVVIPQSTAFEINPLFACAIRLLCMVVDALRVLRWFRCCLMPEALYHHSRLHGHHHDWTSDLMAITGVLVCLDLTNALTFCLYAFYLLQMMQLWCYCWVVVIYRVIISRIHRATLPLYITNTSCHQYQSINTTYSSHINTTNYMTSHTKQMTKLCNTHRTIIGSHWHHTRSINDNRHCRHDTSKTRPSTAFSDRIIRKPIPVDTGKSYIQSFPSIHQEKSQYQVQRLDQTL